MLTIARAIDHAGEAYKAVMSLPVRAIDHSHLKEAMKLPPRGAGAGGAEVLGDKLIAAIGRYKPKRPLYSKPISPGKKRGAPTLMMRALGQLQGLQLRFFKSLLTSSKVPAVMRAIHKALEEDCCVVVGLQSTGGERVLLDLGCSLPCTQPGEPLLSTRAPVNPFPAPLPTYPRVRHQAPA